jgi:antagonist of KipI
MALQVIECGFLVTIQDQGRQGYARFGVPVSGAMDWFGLSAANQLVGNPWDAAGIEMVMQGMRLLALDTCLVAAGGPGFHLQVNGRSFPGWMSVMAPAGSQIIVLNDDNSLWGYLACSGGIATPPVLGSRSTYLRGKFGGLDGRTLQAGDVLPLGQPPAGVLSSLAGRVVPQDALPRYSDFPEIEVILGPQVSAFSAEDLQTFFSITFTVGNNSDRMGYRLEGEPISAGGAADILSEGLAMGAVQVPGNGQPIVMMSDRQTTGGYRKIATVIRADLPILAQCSAGARLHFRGTSVAQAQNKYRRIINSLKQSLQNTDETEYGYA